MQCNVVAYRWSSRQRAVDTASVLCAVSHVSLSASRLLAHVAAAEPKRTAELVAGIGRATVWPACGTGRTRAMRSREQGGTERKGRRSGVQTLPSTGQPGCLVSQRMDLVEHVDAAMA